MEILKRQLFGKLTARDYDDGPERTYLNICCNCSEEFLGYKGRHQCKVCETAYQAKRDAMTPDELKRHDEQRLIELAEASQRLHRDA